MALMQVSFFSEALGLSTQMNVILPQQTRGQIADLLSRNNRQGGGRGALRAAMERAEERKE